MENPVVHLHLAVQCRHRHQKDQKSALPENPLKWEVMLNRNRWLGQKFQFCEQKLWMVWVLATSTLFICFSLQHLLAIFFCSTLVNFPWWKMSLTSQDNHHVDSTGQCLAMHHSDWGLIRPAECLGMSGVTGCRNSSHFVNWWSGEFRCAVDM